MHVPLEDHEHFKVLIRQRGPFVSQDVLAHGKKTLNSSTGWDGSVKFTKSLVRTGSFKKVASHKVSFG
jgi:hypothetical protein